MPVTDVIKKPSSNSKSELKLEILTKERISKNIIRFVFYDHTQVLEPGHESGYIKMQFVDNHQQIRARSYTIRSVVPVSHQVTIDFVDHGDSGPASAWASRSQVGDSITAVGPGPAKRVDLRSDWFIIVGDMTSLPAIAANISRLPETAKGYALVEVADESDIQALNPPAGFAIEWIINSDHRQSAAKMLAAVQNQAWLDGKVYIWVASEFDVARTLREYFREEKGITKNRYISSYWKYGETDEGNKRAKKQDGGF